MELTHGVRCIKGETHSLITLMRLNTRWATRSLASTSSAKRTSSSTTSYYDDEDPSIASFRQLNEYLEGIYDLYEVDCVRYVTPFHYIITSDQASGPLTSAALSSFSKFALYGFFSCHFPNIKNAMNLVADSISSCVFEETDWESDELILMKLLELSTLCYRCNASNTLSVDAAWDIYCTCISIRNHYRASKILKSEAESALIHLTLNIFTRASVMVRSRPISSIDNGDGCDKDTPTFINHALELPVNIAKGSRSTVEFTLSQPAGVAMVMLKIIKVLSDMLSSTAKYNPDTIKFGLQLINVALEAGGTALSSIASLVDVLRNDVCRHLLRATQSEDLGIFSLSLRVVFNLFMSIKDHMKVQLEVFLTSVHLRLLDQTPTVLATATAARDELILESLLEFCREPALMQDLYINYDCDVQCTNLFDAIINTLCRRSTLEIPRLKDLSNKPSKSGNPEEKSKQLVRLNILHKLAFDGLLAILHSMTGKIPIGDNELSKMEDLGMDCPPSASEDNVKNLDRQLKNEVLLEKEIDKWCEIQVDNENLTPEDFEIYSLVTHNAPYSPIHLSKRSIADNQHFFPADPLLSPSQSSSTSSSPSGFRSVSRQRRYSESSCTSVGNVIDRENELTSNLENRTKAVEILRQRKMIKQKLKAISELFNEKPLKQDWLKNAIESGIISTIAGDKKTEGDLSEKVEAQAIAVFLKTIPGLGRTQIGEYISKGPADVYPFHAKVLAEYVKTFDFAAAGGSFVKGLRLFLSFFRLPGEAQCIDRIMEAFAGRFFEQLESGKPFANSDAVFILSFSTIMLNTDLHNPNIAVNKKMTKEEFIRNNRGINDRQDLPREYLENIYEEIKANQIQVDIDVVDSRSTIDYTDKETWNKLMLRVSQDQAPASFTSTTLARKIQKGLNFDNKILSYEVDMFVVIAKPAFETILMLWQHALDDLLLRRIVVGVCDYLQACSNLQLRNALGSAIRVFLWSIGKYLVVTRESSRQLYARSYIMNNRSSYQQWSKESGHDLKRLLHIPVEKLVDGTAGVHGVDAGDPLDWSEAALIKSELLLRVVIRSATETSLNIHKHSWCTLFELLLWARSRGSLPNELAKLSTSFSFHSSSGDELSWKNSGLHCNSYRPSVFARDCYMQAFGVPPAVTATPANSDVTPKTNSNGSWMSFLWSDDSDESSKRPPLSAILIESALSTESHEVFSNANASIHFDNKGHHIRTDDHLLQHTLEKSGLDILFQSLLLENTKRGESLFAGALLMLSRVLQKLNGRSFEAIQWLDTFENKQFEGSIALADIFPTYLLNDEELEFHSNPSELDAAVCLEWIGNFALHNEKTWSKFGDKIKSVLRILLSDEGDALSKKLPYFFERCINVWFRCILHSVNDSELHPRRGSGTRSFWSMLRIFSDLHIDLLANLSGVIGSGIVTLLKMLHYEEIEMSIDDWYLLMGMMTNIWNGWEGRCRVWECISYLINEDLISELNFVPCRNLVLRFLDKNMAIGGKNWMEKNNKEYRANQQEWASNSMLYLLRLALMALGGFIKRHDFRPDNAGKLRMNSHDEGTRTKNSSLFGRLRAQNRETYSFPDANELKAQLFSPTKSASTQDVGPQNDSVDHDARLIEGNHSSNNLSASAYRIGSKELIEKELQLLSPQAPVVDRKKNEKEHSNWLSVPCLTFSRPEELESVWVGTIGALAEFCSVPSLPLIHRAMYCLEVLISSGNVALLPMNIWFKVLDELISKLPLNLVAASSKLQGLPLSDIHETCFRCSNLIFHLIVMHIKELRREDHFAAMFIRSISAMTSNASVSPKGHTTHSEMMSMIIALLRLLRLPELQPQPVEFHEVEPDVGNASQTTEVENVTPGGLLGVLHWMVSPAPTPLPKQQQSQPLGKNVDQTLSIALKSQLDEGAIRVISLDHDGTLFVLTWKAITMLYNQLPAMINSWDPQYCKHLLNGVELVEKIKLRGETDQPFAGEVIKQTVIVQQEQGPPLGDAPQVISPPSVVVPPPPTISPLESERKAIYSRSKSTNPMSPILNV